MITIHPVEYLDRAISYGESCFETVAVSNGTIFDWPRHLHRLITGCSQLGILLNDDDCHQITRTLQHHITDQERIIRLTVTPGEAAWGIATQSSSATLFIQHQPRTIRPATRLISMPTPHGTRPIVAKFGSDYGTMLRLGGRHILQQGATPLLWHRDRLCSAATANIALYTDGHWLTPDADDGGVLTGVIRHHLLAANLLHTSYCDRHLVEQCEAMVLLNSGCLLQEATAVDGRTLPPHQATTALRHALHDIIQRQP